MRISVVVQRYGEEVVGGAERLARGVAEGLAASHQVEVLTSCARAYTTWANHYPAGAQEVNGVRVRRFRVDREREMDSFNRRSRELFQGERTPEAELAWVEAQGPLVPGLVDHVHAVAPDRDVLLFFTYLYYPTLHGIHAAPAKSVLVPTAHDEAPFWMETYRPVFELPAGLVFNTEAERRLVRRRFPGLETPSAVVGAGIDGLDRLAAAAETASPASPPTLLYAGRIEEGKGVADLLRDLRRFRRETGQDVRLWLMGEAAMALPGDEWIEPLGFVSEEEKARRMAAATALVSPSTLESFGIVILEAMAASTPVLVAAAGAAGVEHCRQSDGGLWYGGYEEFREALTLLLSDDRLRRRLGHQGSRYVRERYSWAAVVRRYEDFLAGIA